MTAAITETDAIVLDSREHGESDLIVTLYSPDTGRITAIAKGAKRSKKRFVNKLEIFSFLHISLRQNSNRSLALLEEADLYTSFLTLRQNLAAYTAASVIREFFLLAIRDGEGDKQLFTLVLWALHSLDQAESHLRIVMLFLLRFFEQIGYRPELGCCVQCGSTSENSGDHGFSIVSGGLHCQKCDPGHSSHLITLTTITIKRMQSAQNSKLEHLRRLQIPNHALYEGLKVLHRYGRHILQREIISWNMLRKTI